MKFLFLFSLFYLIVATHQQLPPPIFTWDDKINAFKEFGLNFKAEWIPNGLCDPSSILRYKFRIKKGSRVEGSLETSKNAIEDSVAMYNCPYQLEVLLKTQLGWGDWSLPVNFTSTSPPPGDRKSRINSCLND